MQTFLQEDELTHNITDIRQVAEHGIVTYTLSCLEAAQDGFALDLRNKTCPDFAIGLFTANFVKAEAKPVAEDTTDVAKQITVGKPKAGRPSKAAQTKAALLEKLPAEAVATVSQ